MLFVAPIFAQSDSLAVVSSDSVAEVVASTPVIEYTMQRKIYEIADIENMSETVNSGVEVSTSETVVYTHVDVRL